MNFAVQEGETLTRLVLSMRRSWIALLFLAAVVAVAAIPRLDSSFTLKTKRSRGRKSVRLTQYQVSFRRNLTMKRKRRDNTKTIGLIVAVLTLIGSFCVPEVRRFLHLEKAAYAPPTLSKSSNSLTSIGSVSQQPVKSRVQSPEIKSQPTIKISHQKIKVEGKKNIAGNVVEGQENAVGNGNQVNSPAANSPVSVEQTGKNNIAQIGNNNKAEIEEFDPNKAQVRYEVNGVRHAQVPGKISADDSEVGSYNQLMSDVNAQDWQDARSLAQEQIGRAPEWPTPYFVLGQAEANLCDKEGVSKNLKKFLDMTQNRGDYRNTVEAAKKFLDLIQRGQMPPQCTN